MINTVLIVIQMFFTIIVGIYFFNMLRTQQSSKTSIESDSNRELEKLRNLKKIELTKPLSEKTRPESLDDVVGQSDGIRALRAALCGANPQHVLIYGPPGVGKTAAARVVLNEAKASLVSPFSQNAKFVELDATTLHFDERGIADPLIGSVHDPIYQGAGAYGPAGVPRPKPGAVTKAHGGILFIDEIGEMHPVEINKLLKVLEDRKVFLESSYYSSGNKDIPPYVHEVFQKGLPADFRLVGATTKSPEDIPPAIRSRCVEIFFSPLSEQHIYTIAKNAAQKGNFAVSEEALRLVCSYAQNGRDAVNIVQTAGSVASLESRSEITAGDVKWVSEFGHFIKKTNKKASSDKYVGVVNGLAVFGGAQGAVIDVEASAQKGEGNVTVTGIIEKQEFKTGTQKLTRNSSAKASVQNMMTVLKRLYGIDTSKLDIHVNFPGGMPIDGPSAGVAIMCAVYSAITKKPIRNDIAMTGEISILGRVKPVGGVPEKVAAAHSSGVKRVFIPKDNYDESLERFDTEIIAVEDINEVFLKVFDIAGENISHQAADDAVDKIAAASPVRIATAKENTLL
ncbi:MAG: ATP-dependent protease LonB [Ruminococcaceae bacterium]|nr:ATP-dependent protease LonB [Oscillospiraceae bacterium]